MSGLGQPSGAPTTMPSPGWRRTAADNDKPGDTWPCVRHRQQLEGSAWWAWPSASPSASVTPLGPRGRAAARGIPGDPAAALPRRGGACLHPRLGAPGDLGGLHAALLRRSRAARGPGARSRGAQARQRAARSLPAGGAGDDALRRRVLARLAERVAQGRARGAPARDRAAVDGHRRGARRTLPVARRSPCGRRPSSARCSPLPTPSSPTPPWPTPGCRLSCGTRSMSRVGSTTGSPSRS